VVDDVFINLRYARHLVEGHGLVFNPGERVEGYTELPIVLLAALFLQLRLDPVVGLKCVTAIAAAGTLALAGRLERLTVHSISTARPPVSAILLLSSGAFVYWALCPMGTMFFTVLLLLALVASLEERASGRWVGSGLAFAMLAVTRPEGIHLFAVTTAVLALADRLERGDWHHLGRHAANVTLVAGVVAAHVGWRYAYYGTLLPNTYYAKVTGGAGQLSTGAVYLADGLRAFPVLAASLAAPVLAISARVRRAWRQDWVPPLTIHLVVLCHLGAVLALGGDFMPFFRFLVPVMPLGAVLVATVLATTIPREATRTVLALLLTVHIACAISTEQPYRAFVADRTAVLGERAGKWLGAHLPADSLVALNTAGSLPYYSRLPTIDMLGLTDLQIAHRPVFITSTGWAGHRRGWGDYVLRRRPRVILWYNSVGAAEPFYLSDHELAGDPVFRFFYRLHAEALPAEPGEHGRRLAGFVGTPFGGGDEGSATILQLGLEATVRRGLIDYTTLHEAPALLTYFERDERVDALWDTAWRRRRDLRGFIDDAASHWAAARPATGADPAASAAVAGLCAEALQAIRDGEYERARRVLDQAAVQNRTVHSPLVYQYVANLAVITGHLLTAVDAQKEALRLAPENPRYRDNLLHLLTVPYAEFQRAPSGAGAEPSRGR
jgi:hypothetical protein